MSLLDVLEIEQDAGEISLQLNAKTDGLYLEVEDPWRGDTETGFGAIVGIDLTVEQVKEIYNFLGKWMKNEKHD